MLLIIIACNLGDDKNDVESIWVTLFSFLSYRIVDDKKKHKDNNKGVRFMPSAPSGITSDDMKQRWQLIK